jgi:hypothetical protein
MVRLSLCAGATLTVAVVAELVTGPRRRTALVSPQRICVALSSPHHLRDERISAVLVVNFTKFTK